MIKTDIYNIVMYSSGVGSWAAAKRVAEKYGKDNLILLFADTRIEDEDNYRFLYESAENVGGELIVVCDGRTPWEVITEKKWLNHRTPYCSLLLKIKPCENYLKSDSKFTPANTRIFFGIDWEEFSRMDAIALNWSKFSESIEAPLCWEHYKWLDKNDCINRCLEAGMKPPRLYDQGFSHSNCGGFCVKAGKKHFRNLYNKNPQRYLHHEEEEQKFRAAINRHDVSILRQVVDGVTKSLTLKDFREEMDKEPVQLNIFDEAYGGCGCFIDDFASEEIN
ncbi:MAG: hypothetical protein ACRCZS_24070 [Chroococcidiopsis sp.]